MDQLAKQRGGRRLVKDCVETLLTKVCQLASTERGIPAASPPPWAALALAAQSAAPPPQGAGPSNAISKAAAVAASWPSAAHKTTPRAALVKGVRLARGRNARDCEPRLLDLAVLLAGSSSQQQQQGGSTAGPPAGGAGPGGGALIDIKPSEDVRPAGPGPLDLFRPTRADGSGALPTPVDQHTYGDQPPLLSSVATTTDRSDDPMEDLRARLTRLLVLQVKLPRKRAQLVVEPRKEGIAGGAETNDGRPSFDSKSKDHGVALAKRPDIATALPDSNGQVLHKSSSNLASKHGEDMEGAKGAADESPSNQLGISPPKGKRAATLAAHALLSLAGPFGKKGAAASTGTASRQDSDLSGVASKGTQSKKRLSGDATVVDSRKKRRQEVDDDNVIPTTSSKPATILRSSSEESLVSLGKPKAGGRLKKAGALRSYFPPATENSPMKKKKTDQDRPLPSSVDASQDPASMHLSSSTPCISLKRLSAPGSWSTGPSKRLEAHARKLPGYAERKRFFEETYRSQIDEIKRHQSSDNKKED